MDNESVFFFFLFHFESTRTKRQEASTDLRNITSSACLFWSRAIRWDVALLLRHCMHSVQSAIQNLCGVYILKKLSARQFINTKRKLRQAVVMYSTHVWDDFMQRKWSRRFDIATKLPLLLRAFSFLSIIKHSAAFKAEFMYHFIVIRKPVVCSVPYLCTFQWMCGASYESLGSLDQNTFRRVTVRSYAQNWMYYSYTVKKKSP